MASSNTNRRSRKTRGSGNGPRAVPSARRQEREARLTPAPAPPRMLGSYGPPPQGWFGGIPVSEIAIFIGLIGAVVGIVNGGGAALIIGIAVCALGVLEVTVREHFSGYRSHTTLLSAVPAVLVEAVLAASVGLHGRGGVALLAAVPVFAICFFPLRRAFAAARQSRVARFPSA